MNESSILYHVGEAVAALTFDRTGKLNTLTPVMLNSSFARVA